MTKNPVSLDKWRDYFSSSNSDIFAIIEHAIMVAASDFPHDFKVKRDRIAEMLFTCKLSKCLRCDRTELSVPYDDCLKRMDGDDEFKTVVEAGGSKDSKESKVNSSSRDEDDDHIEVAEFNAKNQVHDQDYDYVEALNDEIEEESQFLEEVVRIKEVIDDSEEKSVEMLFDSLRRLQLMPLSIEILQSTGIGKSVNALRKKHGSKQIRNLCRSLVEDWKCIVDEWAAATAAIVGPGTDVTTESGVEEVAEEEGLPSPPLDDVAFFATSTSMELSQFFDGMDDDGNLRNSGELNKNQQSGRMRIPERTSNPMQKSPAENGGMRIPERTSNPMQKSQAENGGMRIPERTVPLQKSPTENGRMRIPERTSIPMQKSPAENGRMRIPERTSIPMEKSPTDSRMHAKDSKAGNKRNQETTMKKEAPLFTSNAPDRPNPPSSETGARRPTSAMQPNSNNVLKVQPNGTVQKKPLPNQQEKLNRDNGASDQMKLETAKRKLHERYQEAENAKKQRTIQVVELRDLPKQSHAHRKQQMRPGNHLSHRKRDQGRW